MGIYTLTVREAGKASCVFYSQSERQDSQSEKGCPNVPGGHKGSVSHAKSWFWAPGILREMMPHACTPGTVAQHTQPPGGSSPASQG